MIFEHVKSVANKDEFIEKLILYIRLVETIAERNGGLNAAIVNFNDIVSELVDMGVIENSDDLLLLKRIIGSNYDKLLHCIAFYLVNKPLFGDYLNRLNNKKRSELQKVVYQSDKPTFVDLFAGAGGLSCGFIQAGFKVLLANDVEDVCVSTYRLNHPELPANMVLQQDIRSLVDHLKDFVNGDVDVVVGGPPCQGFSSANQQRIIDDPRNELYKYFVKAVCTLLPKFVIMENVKGMLKVADQVVEDYANINEERNGINYSYIVAYKLLNSVDFSVAQSRERLIYIAIRTDIAQERGLTPQAIFDEIDTYNIGKKHFLLSDALAAIKPLEAPRVKNMTEVDDDKTGKKVDFNEYSGSENEYLRLINDNRNMPYVFNHKARYLSDVNYDIYRLLNQGDDASDPKIAGIMPYAHRLYCFKDKYYKLIADRPSRTITAHLKMDCHSHIHPFQVRALTPREAARCQSFPDDYLFLGAYLKTYMQIGNAVPCLMAKGIASVIKHHLS